MRVCVKSIVAVAVAATLWGCNTAPPAPTASLSGGGGIERSSPPASSLGVDSAELGEAGDRVLFDTDSAVIAERYQPAVEAMAGWLRAHPAARLAIEGHADERGTREYNLGLGERRAAALRKALLDRGTASSQVPRTVSYGKERPAVAGSSEAAWLQNRRAVLVVEN